VLSQVRDIRPKFPQDYRDPVCSASLSLILPSPSVQRRNSSRALRRRFCGSEGFKSMTNRIYPSWSNKRRRRSGCIRRRLSRARTAPGQSSGSLVVSRASPRVLASCGISTAPDMARRASGSVSDLDTLSLPGPMIAGNPAAMGQMTRHGRGRMCRCTGSAGASRSGPAGPSGTRTRLPGGGRRTGW
jgi:hypothetical protein